MKKSSKKRSLCFVLALMLSIGFCLAGIPAKRVAADDQIGGNKPFDEKTFLMVGDDIIIKGGQWNADLGEKLKGSGDDTYYEDELGHFIIQKYYIGGDYSDVILTFTQDGGHCGGIILDCIKLQFGGMTQEVLDEDEHNQDDHTFTFNSMIDAVIEENAEKATNTNKDINDHYSGFNDAIGYSVYCASGGFEFNYSPYHVGRASFQYNLAGGIRYGGSSGVKISGDTIVNIGTEIQASSTGISNVDCGGKTRYTPPENDHYFYIAGELNIIANWIFRDVDFVYVEGGSLSADQRGNDAVIEVNQDDERLIADKKTDFEVAYGGKIEIRSNTGIVYEVVGVSGDKHLKQDTDIEKGEDDNSEYVEVSNSNNPNTADTDFYTFEASSNRYLLEDKGGKLTNVGWNDADHEDGGGVRLISGRGFVWGDRPGEHSYKVETGSDLTIEVLPKYGFQYNTAGFREADTEKKVDSHPEKDTAIHTFTVGNYAISLAGRDMYVPADDKIESKDSSAVNDAQFILGEDGTKEKVIGEDGKEGTINGNLIVTVSDSEANGDDFVKVAEGEDNEVLAILDISVGSQVEKNANSKEYWPTNNIKELNHEATVLLELSEDLMDKIDGSDVQVVRDHDGKKEIVEGKVVTIDGKKYVEIKSSKYSSFAIIYKDVDDNNNNNNNNNNPPPPPGSDDDDDDDDDGENDGPPTPPEEKEWRDTVKDKDTGIAVELNVREDISHYMLFIEELLEGLTPEDFAEAKELLKVPDGYEFLTGHMIFTLSDASPEAQESGQFEAVYGRDPVISFPVADLVEKYDLKLIYYVDDDYETFVKYPEFKITDGKLVVGDVETDGFFFIIGKPKAAAADVKTPDTTNNTAANTTTKKTDTAPQTGDSSALTLMFTLLIASAGLMILVMRKKKRSER